MMKKNRTIVFLSILSIPLLIIFYGYGRSLWVPLYHIFTGKRTVAGVVEQYGPAARLRLDPAFEKKSLSYPPALMTWVGLKEEKRLELWASDDSGGVRRWVLVKSYDILAASGKPGPKLREGDRQVPEGLYGIAGLNPNSSYHLSLKIDYPNAFDMEQAGKEGRDPGSDIFIHGKDVSIGCLAMGDEAAEELFVLAHDVGRENIRVILSPRDFRFQKPDRDAALPDWALMLYETIEAELQQYRE